MNDDDLRKKLAALRVPEPSEASRERAWHRAVTAWKNAPEETPARLGWSWPWVAAGTLFAAVFVALWITLPPPAGAPVAWERTLREFEALFPGQLNAVIERDGTFAVETSPRDVGGAGQPVVVEFLRGRDVLRVLSYSGRQVRVDLNGREARFEPLVTADGGVILSGEDFVWSEDRPEFPGGYRVRARFLHPAS